MRACPPEWKWLFATLQRYNVKHKHNQGKRVANGIACSKEAGNATSTLHSWGSPNKGGQNQKSKAPLGVTMMPLGAPSISKYGSLVRPDAQIVALRLRRPLKVHSRRPSNLSIPFLFNKPNTSSNHSRTSPLSIPWRFSNVLLLRSKTFPTKSTLRDGSVTDFGPTLAQGVMLGRVRAY